MSLRSHGPFPCAGLLAVALIVTGSLLPAHAQKPAPADTFGKELLERINARRKKAGAPPMVPNKVLAEGAARYAGERAKADAWERGGKGAMGSVPDTRLVAPAFWGGWGSTATDAWIEQYLEKPASKGYFLDPDVTQFGASSARAPSGKIYAIVLLGKERVRVSDEKARKAFLEEIVRLVNVERRKAKVKPLRVAPVLEKAAQAHAENMARQEKMEHELDGKNPTQRMRAAGYRGDYTLENIAKGALSASALMKLWMNSPPHRKNILEPNITDIGVGIAQSGKSTEQYFCQCFGKSE